MIEIEVKIETDATNKPFVYRGPAFKHFGEFLDTIILHVRNIEKEVELMKELKQKIKEEKTEEQDGLCGVGGKD